MRDNHKGMPEIVNALEKGGHFFCTVGIEHNDTQIQFRFGISRDGYLTLRRLFEMRPFDSLPGITYRYFFAPGIQRLSETQTMMTVRIEQGKNCKQIEIETPTNLAANLKWFFELDNFTEAEHLRIES